MSTKSQDEGVQNQAAEEASFQPMIEEAEPSRYVLLEDEAGNVFYILGTAHVSEASRRETVALIEKVRPDRVCIELCQERYDAVTSEDRWRKLDIFQVIRSGKFFYLLSSLALSAYQRRLGAKLGVEPGAEFVDAARVAEELGIEVKFIDRNIHITLNRAWGSLSFWSKLKVFEMLLAGLFGGEDPKLEDIEALKEEANLTQMMDAFAEELPQVKEALINERDCYMVAKMRQDAPKCSVVIVGGGHVPGMRSHFNDPIVGQTAPEALDTKPIDLKALESRIKAGKLWTLLKWLFPLALIAFFGYALWSNDYESFEQMLMAWILPNAFFCFLFALLAWAHPLTIFASIFVSPITSTIPIIGAGIVLGLLEAWLRKPKVEDCDDVANVHTLRDFYRNPITHILLVAVLTTFGSALGAWIGLGWLTSLLGVF